MAKVDKKAKRLKRAKKTRCLQANLRTTRLVVHRSAQHILAQVIDVSGKVLAYASSVGRDLRAKSKDLNKTDVAKLVGQKVADLAKQAGVSKVAFDRSGFAYHGRVKALADAARENGLEF